MAQVEPYVESVATSQFFHVIVRSFACKEKQLRFPLETFL